MSRVLEAAELSEATDEVDGMDVADAPIRSLAERSARMSKAILFALGMAVILIAVSAPGIGEDAGATDGPRLGGDLPAFYAAGSIVLDGDIDQLYDAGRQQVAQEALGIDGYLAFAYAPHVAVAYAPLSALDFRVAYVVHTFAMAAAVVAAIHLLSDVVPAIRRWRWQLLAGCFTFVPLITSVGGGQNASLSLLALAVVWWSLAKDREVLAGIAAGLLMFRPQYALPVIGLLLLSRHWRAVACAAAVIIATWFATAMLLGAGWVQTWLEQVVPFVERDAEVNAANSISLLGAFQAVLGVDSIVAQVLGVVGAAAVVITLVYLWLHAERFALETRMGAIALGVVLISPHTMFYDATLLTVAGAATLALRPSTAGRVLAATWLAAFLHFANDALGFTPLAVIAAAAFVLFVVSSSSPSASAEPQKALHHA